jgi:hypothetical protein
MIGACRRLSAILAVVISRHQFFKLIEPPGVASALLNVV